MRALAAFLVFSWHFTHGRESWPIPFGYAPSIFLLAPLDEGHTGVALFMTLSGYLFAKLVRPEVAVLPVEQPDIGRDLLITSPPIAFLFTLCAPEKA